ncbi:hypothetical protein DPMN_020212 [Dreissena polymorpha]|uniref:Uncharacterized protein n=1 Tax=Dreissena polymorpha TaxID=45954 RepID=A0A9D4S8V5_DREPO|nr:hypothetical protein DPMN_020212 [Dreissena polymorpha]
MKNARDRRESVIHLEFIVNYRTRKITGLTCNDDDDEASAALAAAVDDDDEDNDYDDDDYEDDDYEDEDDDYLFSSKTWLPVLLLDRISLPTPYQLTWKYV